MWGKEKQGMVQRPGIHRPDALMDIGKACVTRNQDQKK